MSEPYSLSNIVPAGTSYVSAEAESMLLPRLLQTVLSTDAVLLKFRAEGVPAKAPTELVDALAAGAEALEGGRVIRRNEPDVRAIARDTGMPGKAPDPESTLLIWADGSFIEVDIDGDAGTVSMDGRSIRQGLLEFWRALAKEYLAEDKRGVIYTLIQEGSSLAARSIGCASSEFIPENYLPDVVSSVEYVVSAFAKSPPSGRIVILNGEPGTGKTHLARSLLTQVDAVFILVPSSLVDSLDKPDFIPTLLQVKKDHKKPIVLLVEDGDVCLVPRRGDNISTIAALLNLSDGIMGSLLDIRLVITTNASIREMDQAIMRPGRLCRDIHVGALPYEQANRVYRRLMSSETASLEQKKAYTLAEVYATANGGCGPVVGKPREAIGFSAPTKSKDLTVNSGGIGFK